MAKRNPEKRMSLGGHLRELRNRLYWSALFVGLGSIAGWFCFDIVFEFLQKPFKDLSQDSGLIASINFGSVAAPFDLRLQISIFLGIVFAAPIWLYHFWAYISPALDKKTRRVTVVFVAIATPLFFSGCYIAWAMLPQFVKSLLSFAPIGSATIINANDYILFALRVLVVFGVALVLPAVLLLLNYLGTMSGASILKGWRIAIVMAFVISALATPVSDPMSMFLLAVPLIALYFLAALIAKLLDRRRKNV